jgi:PAS domain S-box-containing protein
MDELESHHCFFRSIVDQMLDLVTITDLEGRILFLSPSTDQLLGRGAQERVGRSLYEFIHPADVERVHAAFDEAVQSGEPGRPIEYRCRHRDGDWRVLESIAGRCLDPRGMMLMLVQSRDATERSATSGKDAQAHALEEAASLSGSIARDFNELLIVLAREVAMLETGADSPRGNAQVMRTAIDRANALVNQLLAFSRLDDVSRVESADVNRTLEEIAGDLQRVSGPGIEIIYLLGAAEPHVGLSRASLERALVALIARARDGMPKGGRVTVLTRNTVATTRPAGGSSARTGQQVVVELTDTGSGLTDEEQRRMFEPDRAPDGAESSLHRALAVVRRAGGDVAVDSGLRGTTVRLQLPTVQP